MIYAENIYLAVAIYFKSRDSQLGFKILNEQWAQDQLPDAFIAWLRNNGRHLNDQLLTYKERGIHFTYLGAQDYPQSLSKNLEIPPLWISYEGKPCWNHLSQLAVVGSRKMSTLSKDWINQELYALLKKYPLCVLSGGARGVDQAAHFCSLRSHRPTMVFLPSGLERVYPLELQEWKQEILHGGGCLISEYWPDVETRKHLFVQRNRLIAAMADAVLIVQGEKRSGTMLTAKWATDLGLEVGVVPGHPMDGAFSGNLELIRSGANPIVDHIDLLCLLGGNVNEFNSTSIV